MQKKLVQSSLALAAATALGLGGAFVAGPAAADQPEVKVSSENAVQTAVHENLSDKDGELVSELGRFGTDGDKLVVGVAKKTEKVKAFASKYDNVKIVVDSKYTEAEPQAQTDLVGGAGYLVSVPSMPGYNSACSTGFAGWDGQGNQVVLTAGHCAIDTSNGAENKIVDTELPSTAEAADGNGESFEPTGVGSFGTWEYHQFGSDIIDNGDGTGSVADVDKAIDFAVIKVNDGFTTKPEVTDWTTAGQDDLSAGVKKVSKVGVAVEGESIQKSGRTTGLTTGTVSTQENSIYWEYANIGGRAVHGFEVKSGDKPFSAPGDSGGAVFQGETAVGVISGGPTDQSPDHGEWSWVADLENSFEKADKSISFEDPNEQPEAPAAPTVSDQTIEPKGEITGKAAAGADVKVTWTGTAEGEATAKADDSGNFTLEGPGAEGDYEAKAVATVDGQSSDAASFKITVEEADGSATADGDDATASADADAKEADASSAAEGDDSEASADADGAEADASSAADGDDADSSAAAEGKDDKADSDADGDEKPEAPKVGDQTVVEGGKITGKAAPNAEVKLTWKPAGDAQAGSAQAQAAPAEGTATVKTDADGNFSAEAPAEAGDYAYSATVTADGQTSEATNFTVTVQAAEAERNLTIEPKEIAASEFVQEDKGVQITAEGFEEGEEVTLKVVDGPEGVKDYEMTEAANADGVVGFSIYGTSADNAEAYLGKYDVQVTGANDTEDEDALTGSFEVVADEDGNGGGNDGDDDGNGDGGSDLPRTGAELTGLAAGAGLLLVGGAAVVLTMRRKKNN